ncbi:kinase-like domain-containing protein [Aspergillus insuetus]
MAALHRHGVCHGDFRPGNVLLKLDGLNGLRVKEVCEYFDYPYISDIEVAEGYPNPGSSAPKYVVCPAKPENDRLATAANLCVIDYGEAFYPATPPENGVGIPLAYCAPEIILGRKCGFASDIWALAATIFEIRTGDKLFKLGFDILVEMFGPMPEPWWSTTWQNRGEYWRDEADANGRAVPRDEESGPSDSSIIRELGGDILYFFLSPRGKWIDVQVPEKEKPLFEDLLRMMMKWKPEDRPSAKDVLKHPWFALDDEEGELFQEMKIKIFESEDEETDDEESGDDSKDDEIEDKAEAHSDGREDEEMLDGEMEGADAENSQPNPHRQESLKLHEKDHKKIAVSRDTKESHNHDQKDDQEDGQ